ncbi:OsmC-like protein [Roseovarius azorensis]|uniref:OsmC-like protein n=1 Tax=Roseovarius azorensis TaxID=1287727 RepID=A0A1H7LYA8_9RHOB|nr:OsmC family protein [Roseovarius azorensis]SEL03862.1 OsmC-like protein [Roseovarius azorensis]
MSDLAIELHWQRAESALQSGQYSNAHTVQYNNTSHEVPVDAAPDWGGDPDHTNPEQALASALSSCHMMTFLALSAKAGWPVASYHDYAVAHLGKNARGQMSVARIDLHPVVRFDTGFAIDAKALAEMQHRAHRYCFIANTLAESVEINIL